LEKLLAIFLPTGHGEFYFERSHCLQNGHHRLDCVGIDLKYWNIFCHTLFFIEHLSNCLSPNKYSQLTFNDINNIPLVDMLSSPHRCTRFRGWFSSASQLCFCPTRPHPTTIASPPFALYHGLLLAEIDFFEKTLRFVRKPVHRFFYSCPLHFCHWRNGCIPFWHENVRFDEWSNIII